MRRRSRSLPPLSRCAGALLLAAVALVCLARTAGRAGPPERDPQRAFSLAEAHFRAGELLEAEPLYQRALEATDEQTRASSYERLVVLYAALGRVDRAIQVGFRYRDWLDGGGHRAWPDRARRRRDLEIHLGECFLALGHYRTAEAHLERALAEARDADPLPPLKRLTVLTDLARSASRSGDRDRAGRFGRQVEELALTLLDRPARPLGPEEQIECTWKLASCYRFLGKPGAAIERLTPLLRLHDRLGDPAGKRDTLRRLAGHHATQAEYDRAEGCLRQALESHERAGSPDRLLRAELAAELAEALARQGRADEARRWRTEAAGDYQAVLTAHGHGGPEITRVITAFWRLQQLYQNTSQDRQALQLAEAQAQVWADTLLADPQLQSEEGTLRVVLGSFGAARPRLRAAVAELERQDPPNLVDLPRALNNLAVIEQATGGLDRAEELAQRCLKLYREHRLPEDLVVVEAHNVLGACSAARGEYALAIERYRAGIALCGRLGRAAARPRCNLLLNVALLHRSQGDVDEAAGACAEALVAYRTFAEPDALGFAAFAAAQAGLDAVRGRFAQAHAHTPRILELCRKHGVESGPLLVAAWHCEGLYRLQRREFDAAERAWRQVLALQEKEKISLLLPRTLNYLGLTAELHGRPKEAEALYRRALGLQRDNPRTFPVTHFITLWRLAGLADRGNSAAAGKAGEARRLLEEAVGVVEQARLRTYGAARERAAFFAQFEPGFEQLFQRCLRDGDVEAALAAATRGRSRNLLDQLQLAGVDPRAALRGPRGEELRRQEEEVRRRISGLRARAQLIPAEAVGEELARGLLADLDRAQKDYAAVWREVLNASPALRELSARDPSLGLSPARRGRILGPKTLLLVYHVGRERSHLLLLGGPAVRPEAFPLVVAAGLAGHVARPDPPSLESALRGRGPIEKERRQEPEEPVPPVPAPGAPTSPLSRELARALVDHYCQQIADPGFRPTRGFQMKPRDPARPVPSQSPTLLGDVLLPAAARRRIREHGAECLVVVPDGPLQKLPLEALLLEAGPRPRYAVDELPPIVYAPSAAILPLLADRPRPAAAGPSSLLTVSNPAYPQGPGPSQPARPPGSHVLGLRGQLRLLPFTTTESRRIRTFFDPSRVTALEGEGATERAVTGAVAGKRVVHLAVHGFADERFGNLFGALALTPPLPGTDAPDDGFLSLHEIYLLPLQECEVAVLSACVTQVGPQRPLEAGVTLANGFLAAGARRVVASHWGVDDQSTAALMTAFFEELGAAARRGERAPYARALQQARLKLRGTPQWSAPYFWAPFVLSGLPD